MSKFNGGGYQGKKDAMRERAKEWLGNYGDQGSDVIYSASAVDKEKGRPRLYKTGGYVAKDENYKKGGRVCRQKFAAGGVAKIRHGEATASGAPKHYKKQPISRMD